ncbi:hypothetical protein ACQP04_22835 [Pseudonocardia halophobica]|uniref:hypothetical protein n=1 Tax=Pseudonocardia halophobica TaxID=29401 RepID=UPI003D94F410
MTAGRERVISGVTGTPTRNHGDDGDDRDDGADALDVELVAQIVRRAGLDCRIDGTSPFLLRARTAARDHAPWTVIAGTCHNHPAPRAFVGPAGSTRTRVLREPDERHLAALVVLQALRRDPHELLTHDEASASGLADNLIWA